MKVRLRGDSLHEPFVDIQIYKRHCPFVLGNLGNYLQRKFILLHQRHSAALAQMLIISWADCIAHGVAPAHGQHRCINQALRVFSSKLTVSMWARVEACEDISKHMHRCNTPVSGDMLHFVALDCVTGVNYAIPIFFLISAQKKFGLLPGLSEGLVGATGRGSQLEGSVFLSPHSRLI